MTADPRLKIAGFSLCLLVPLLVPLGAAVGTLWLAPLVMFGVCPLLGLLVGQDASLPLVGLRTSRARLLYLRALPRFYVVVWTVALLWSVGFVARSELRPSDLVALIIGVGASGALAICTAHELLHRRSPLDTALARGTTALCLYGHMVVEHLHHHATLGSAEYGATARRGMSVYHFAIADFPRALKSALMVERSRLNRRKLGRWHNKVLQDYAIGFSALLSIAVLCGAPAAALFVGQAAFAIFAFEAITYLHHYGLVREWGQDVGSHHAWAHHCWITNCLTFNNTFHADHHLRPFIPYYELHAMHGSPRLPASYFTMFFVALMPPLWYSLIHPRLDAWERCADDMPKWSRMEHCR